MFDLNEIVTRGKGFQARHRDVSKGVELGLEGLAMLTRPRRVMCLLTDAIL